MESKGTITNGTGTRLPSPSGKQKRYRGLGKAGAKRLGQMLRKAIQEREGVQGNKKLPKTTVGLFKHQADVMAKVLSGEKRKLVPRVSDLILQVIAQCKRQGGITMVELKKALAAGGYDVSKNNTQVNRAVKGLVRTETLLRTPGQGTTDSYRFNTKTTKLKDGTRGRTRAARKREAGKAAEACPQLEPSTAERVNKRSREAETNKLNRKAMPNEKSAKPANTTKPTKAAPSSRQAKQKGGSTKAKTIKRNRRGEQK